MFATSFFPSADTTQNQDFAPRPMGSSAAAAVTDEPSFLTPIGESPEHSSAPMTERSADAGTASSETMDDATSAESHRSKRKERRKKGSSSSPAHASDAAPAQMGMTPEIPELTPTREAFASADLPPAPTFAEPDAPVETQLRMDPFESAVVQDEGGSRWFIVGVVVVLLGAAAALFMYMR